MTTMVRMPIELKERLEALKDQHGKKTVYDVIEFLIETVDRQKARISELQKDSEAKDGRIEREYAYLGIEMKKQLSEFQQHVRLKNSADAVDFLISNFDGSLTMNRIAFDTYVRLRG